MILWIARDKDGKLRLFNSKPQKHESKAHNHYWIETVGGSFIIDSDSFPEVTFKNSPKQVEVTLKKRIKRLGKDSENQ